MDWGSPSFVIAIIAVSYGAWILNNWIRAKHGYELEDEWGGKSLPKKSAADSAEAERLKAENRELNDKLDTMQDRMIVLEKIVTDRGYSLSEEIEALRDTPVRSTSRKDNGVPLDLGKKEPSA
ncbi:hypothetical protein [uncultured Erythrobacter sp.]|uniref:hypothetical protein n=1 Tax=uncultured Erythrobacter sp. TaxID=263913 RepID=UPI00263711A9|nr:hypothetical protein [uncultured Erythrobacter sp.]